MCSVPPSAFILAPRSAASVAGGPTKTAVAPRRLRSVGFENVVFLECPAKAARIGGGVRAAFAGACFYASSPACLDIHWCAPKAGNESSEEHAFSSINSRRLGRMGLAHQIFSARFAVLQF
jgi:hypothetical protein